MTIEALTASTHRLIKNIETVIVGKRDVVRLSVATLLSGGHMLIDDIPGVGKTMLARSLASSIGGSFKRIQFTPDLLPADITGVSIYDRSTNNFEFRPGPIFANVVLADEINRATPKSQSALLEAMDEFQVTADGQSRPVPRPFFVVATQNPIEYEGTFDLPEAQLDRFMTRISLGYPSHEDEVDVLTRQMLVHPIEGIEAITSPQQVLQLQRAVREIHVDDSLKHYAVNICEHTRRQSDLDLGASPRGSIALVRVAQGLAAVSGRDYVVPDDMKAVAVATLAHRLVVKPSRSIQGLSAQEVIEQVLDSVEVPVIQEAAK